MFCDESWDVEYRLPERKLRRLWRNEKEDH